MSYLQQRPAIDLLYDLRGGVYLALHMLVSVRSLSELCSADVVVVLPPRLDNLTRLREISEFITVDIKLRKVR